jgi:hypothetical protein
MDLRLDMLNQNRRRSQLALDRASGPAIPRNLDAPPIARDLLQRGGVVLAVRALRLRS